MVTDCFTRERSFHAFPKTQRPQGEKRDLHFRFSGSSSMVIFGRISIFMSVHTAFMLRSCLGFNFSSSPVCGRPGMCALMGAPRVTKSPTDFLLLPAVSYSAPLIQSWRCVPRDEMGWAETRGLHDSLQVDGAHGGRCLAGAHEHQLDNWVVTDGQGVTRRSEQKAWTRAGLHPNCKQVQRCSWPDADGHQSLN